MKGISEFFSASANLISFFFKTLRENRLKAILAVALIAFAAVGLAFLDKKGEPRPAKNVSAIPAAPIEPLKDEFLLMSEDDFFERDFQINAEPQQSWNEDKTEKWFVAPDSQMLGELEAANNLAVTEILDGVP